MFRGPTPPSRRCSRSRTGRDHLVVTHAGGGYSRRKDLALTAGARTRRRTTGGRSATSRRCRHRGVLVDSTPAHAPARRSVRDGVLGGPRRVPEPGQPNRSRATPKSRCRPRTTSSCAGCACSTIAAARAGRSRSPATPRWRSPPPRPTRCTRPSAISSSRRKSSRTSARSSAPGARARAARRRPGCSTSWRRMGARLAAPSGSEPDRLRFLGRGRTPADPRAMHRAVRSGATDRCSIRSRRSAAVHARTGRDDHD